MAWTSRVDHGSLQSLASPSLEPAARNVGFNTLTCQWFSCWEG